MRINPRQGVLGHPLDASPAAIATRFAHAVAARADEILIVHPNNTAHWEPWAGGAVPVAPYAVHIASARGYRTLALDFDGGEAARQAEQAASILREAGLRHVLTRSGPHNRYHVLATFIDWVAPAAMARMGRVLRRRFPSLDDGKLRNPETGAIRPPLSPHRVSGRSEPLGSLADALAILETGNPVSAWRRFAEVVGVPLLTPRMERLLRQGDESSTYRSRSEVVHAIALAHANARSSQEHLLDDLLDPSNAAGNKVREKRDPRRYVHQSWSRACARVERSPLIRNRTQAVAYLTRVRAGIDAAPWPGRTGATRYAIMQAHLAVAERVGGPEYHASVRDIADGAGVHVATVIRHLRYLLRVGWLRRRGLRYPGHATRWRLVSRLQPYNLTPPVRG